MKKKTTLTINEDLVELAKRRKINISKLVEEVLVKVLLNDKEIEKKCLEMASTCVSCENKFELNELQGTDWIGFDHEDKVLYYDNYCNKCLHKDREFGSFYDSYIQDKTPITDGYIMYKALLKYFYDERLNQEIIKLI